VIPFRLTFSRAFRFTSRWSTPRRKLWSQDKCGQGDAFPSVRALSQALKINPNTAHKVVTHLINDGLLEAHPGLGTVVSERAASTASERSKLLRTELEQLVVEAKRMGLALDDVTTAVTEHWKRLDGSARSKA
jgi:GntR family transcriptional regulator